GGTYPELAAELSNRIDNALKQLEAFKTNQEKFIEERIKTGKFGSIKLQEARQLLEEYIKLAK
ncbi:MAG: hypothetical protein KDD56_09925, partial [Bdellovibrionales bacterium]|nr:hypothetical protein [Bdellovibrionales bacterium]